MSVFVSDEKERNFRCMHSVLSQWTKMQQNGRYDKLVVLCKVLSCGLEDRVPCKIKVLK